MLPIAKPPVKIAGTSDPQRRLAQEKVFRFGTAEVGGENQSAARVIALQIVHLHARGGPAEFQIVQACTRRNIGGCLETVGDLPPGILVSWADVLQRVRLEIDKWNRSVYSCAGK